MKTKNSTQRKSYVGNDYNYKPKKTLAACLTLSKLSDNSEEVPIGLKCQIDKNKARFWWRLCLHSAHFVLDLALAKHASPVLEVFWLKHDNTVSPKGPQLMPLSYWNWFFFLMWVNHLAIGIWPLPPRPPLAGSGPCWQAAEFPLTLLWVCWRHHAEIMLMKCDRVQGSEQCRTMRKSLSVNSRLWQATVESVRAQCTSWLSLRLEKLANFTAWPMLQHAEWRQFRIQTRLCFDIRHDWHNNMK